MKRGLLTILFCKAIALISLGQQEPIFSQYMMNPFSLNPAVSSTEDYIDVQTGLRSQWKGLTGAPRTIFASAHGTINKPFYHFHYKAEHKNWHGVGFQFMDDRIGPQQRNALLFAYSYNMALTKRVRLSVGTFAGVKQLKVDHTHWQHIQDETDVLFLNDLNTGLRPELQFGAVLYRADDFYVSVALQNLIGNKLSFNEVQEDLTDGELDLHTYLSAGKKIVAGGHVNITPSTMVWIVPGTSVAFDLNGKLDYDDSYWIGGGIRSTKVANLFVGLNILERVDATFAYDLDFTPLSNYQSGTYEMIIGLRLDHPNVILDPSQFWD